MRKIKFSFAVVSAATLLVACGGGDDPVVAPVAPAPEETRAQDSRKFTTDTTVTTFAAMAAVAGDAVDVSTTSRWAGVLNGASYRVEVPANWNGKLVMWAHGFRGSSETTPLRVTDPHIRRYLIQNGYAWAASSYSTNYYDVRAGVEDTNALALEFTKIAAKNSRTLTAPSRMYIHGESMGGHITAAAIEDEAKTTAKNKVNYNGAVPICGVLGDTALFDQFAGIQVAAQVIAGVPNYPTAKFGEILPLVQGILFSSFPSAAAPTAQITPTATGAKFVSVLKNITGGERPMFNQGLAFGGAFPSLWVPWVETEPSRAS